MRGGGLEEDLAVSAVVQFWTRKVANQVDFIRMPALEKDVLQVVSRLSRVNPLRPDSIAHSSEVSHMSVTDSKRTLKVVLSTAKSVHRREQFGKLRAAILLGVTLFGDAFLLQAERSGLLLSNAPRQRGFGKFLNDLAYETADVTNFAWATLHHRLNSYLAFEAMLDATVITGSDISSLLRTRPRRSVKMALAIAELSFLRKHFQFDIPPELSTLIDELGSPEEISSIASLLVVVASDEYPLDSLDFALPSGGVELGEVRALMSYGKALVEQFEIGKYISLFRYDLEKVPGQKLVFYLRPPSGDFEYSLRLGFIRSQVNAGRARVDVATKGKDSVLSLVAAAERFAQTFRTRLGVIAAEGTEWRRLRVNFPMLRDLYDTIKNNSFYEDALSYEQDADDYLLPLRLVRGAEIKLTEHLDIETFHGLWRYFTFLDLVDIALLRSYSASDPTVLLNSLVRVSDRDALIELLGDLGISKEQARDFIDVVSVDLKNPGYLDLQYRPFLRIAQTWNPEEQRLTKPEIIHLPAILCTSNVGRNVQSANKFRLKLNARVFVDAVFQALRSRFCKVARDRMVDVTGIGATDVDVVLLEGNTLYLFECKHSLPPTGPHEMRDSWEDIERGVEQLEKAISILGDFARRQSYLAGWFPGTRAQTAADLKIVGCVLCSHRIFSGLHYKGFPIRDFASLARLCADGIVGMGYIAEDEVLLRQYRIIGDKVISAVDLDDYLSQGSTYFKSFRPFMHPVSRIERLGGVTIGKETYVYEMDLSDWIEHMEALGCERAADRRQKLKPLSTEILSTEENSAKAAESSL
jgi:hypothetical protein